MTNSQLPKGSEDTGAGLCEACVHSLVIENGRGSRFYLCERSKMDPRFPRYPRLPVLACIGYERAERGVRGPASE
jgi:hypothetical protein